MDPQIEKIAYGVAGFLGSVLLTILGFFVKYVISRKEKQDDKDDASLKEILKDHTSKIAENTLALVKLQVTMDFIIKKTESIFEIEKDVDALHKKMREMKN